jgi:hypothetical protein
MKFLSQFKLNATVLIKMSRNSKPIVGCGIEGGLGNKLFQMAHMFAFAQKHGYEPHLHSRHIQRAHHERARWHHFHRNACPIDFVHKEVREPFEKACRYLDFQPFPDASNIVLHGFFQSEKYFENCKSYIYEQFCCPDEERDQILKSHPGIEQGLFLHVRRGDNVNNPFHYIDLDRYYARALSHFNPDTVVYVFSDDIDYCKSYQVLSSVKNKVFVKEPNEIKSLWMMSLCGRGGIGANSTFSWWGAWLAKQRYGDACTIVYPDRQFPHDKIDYRDIVPPSFIKERTD